MVNCVMRYDSRSPDHGAIMRRHCQLMVERDRRLEKVFPVPPRMSYTRPPNLREILCRAKLTKTRQGVGTGGVEPGFTRCGARTCSLCPFTGRAAEGKKVTQIKIKHSGQVEDIRDSINCRSRNVLYLLSCEQQTGKDLWPAVCWGDRKRS